MIKINASNFQWSSTEQIYPLERGPNGETLYCQRKYLGSLPSATFTVKQVYPDSYVDSNKVIRFWGTAHNGSNVVVPMPYMSNEYTAHWILFTFPNGSFVMYVGTLDWINQGYTAYGYVIYYK